MESTITFGSLFSGIGGIDLGLERAGMQCKWQVECDEFCNRVLARHWPLVPRLADVRDVSASTVEAVDLICGGWPCQPVSLAGKRQGDGDHRWLWPQFARVVDELRPSLVLLENVPGLLSLGGAEVAADLASLGYDAEWHCFPAAAVGAWHRRKRFWCIAADAESVGCTEGVVWSEQSNAKGGCSTVVFGGDFESELSAAFRSHRGEGGIWETFSTVGALASGVQHRVAKLRAIGNSVVPQVAEVIGRRIYEASR